MKHRYLYRIYVVIMAMLALLSVVLFVLDYDSKINLLVSPWNYIDNSILIIFTVDYLTRLFIAKNKWKFIRNNIFDLLAILPFDSLFSIFRIARIGRVLRLFKLMRMIRFVGVLGRFGRIAKKFLNTNGLIWTLIVATVLIITSAMVYSLAESVPFGESVWWAITTTTTVGYGDISPQTPLGKTAAVTLMFTGIGVIGMLTSAITSYFQNDEDQDRTNEIISEIQKLQRQNEELKSKVDKLNSKMEDK